MAETKNTHVLVKNGTHRHVTVSNNLFPALETELQTNKRGTRVIVDGSELLPKEKFGKQNDRTAIKVADESAIRWMTQDQATAWLKSNDNTLDISKPKAERKPRATKADAQQAAADRSATRKATQQAAAKGNATGQAKS